MVTALLRNRAYLLQDKLRANDTLVENIVGPKRTPPNTGASLSVLREG